MSGTIAPSQVSKSRPVLITFSVLAGAQVLTGGAALADVLPKDVVGLLILAVAAVQAGMTFYVQGQVTPWSDVVSKRTPDGQVIAGPAAEAPTGSLIPDPDPAPEGDYHPRHKEA